MTDWRKIEAALVEWFRSQEAHVWQHEGDWLLGLAEDGFKGSHVNLTALARHLADELGGK